MLPTSKNSGIIPPLKKPKTPPDLPTSSSQDLIISNLNRLYFLSTRSCIILLFLLLIFSLYFPFLPSTQPHPNPNPNPNPSIKTDLKPHQTPDPNPTPDPPGCELGTFYVYDLPPSLNQEFIDDCDNISPWGSQCRALSNNGLGRKATGLDHIIPNHLQHTWYWTDQFSLEVIFHQRLLNHKCRTHDPGSATAYYIPFYAGLAVGKYLWGDNNLEERDMHCKKMLEWVRTQHLYYNKSNGLDHFLAMGRISWDFRRKNDSDWGSRCMYLPPMRKITRLLIEREHRDYFDVGVPYPTGFHPGDENDVVAWQDFIRSRDRHALFCFVGGPRGEIKNDFRGLLLNQCKEAGQSCGSVDCTGSKCSNGTSKILETFLDSDFCLQPRGDSYTRRSVFDCMVAGSIPVFFWRRTAYVQYPWFLPEDPRSYSVYIDHSDVRNGTSIKEVLEKYSKEEVKKMREKVIEILPKISYAKLKEGLKDTKDAVDLAIDGVLKRIERMDIHANDNAF